VGVLTFFIAATIGAYKEDLGLTTGVLWLLVFGGPLVVGVLTYGVLKAIYPASAREREPSGTGSDATPGD
jgi:cytochrome b-561